MIMMMMMIAFITSKTKLVLLVWGLKWSCRKDFDIIPHGSSSDIHTDTMLTDSRTLINVAFITSYEMV